MGGDSSASWLTGFEEVLFEASRTSIVGISSHGLTQDSGRTPHWRPALSVVYASRLLCDDLLTPRESRYAHSGSCAASTSIYQVKLSTKPSAPFATIGEIVDFLKPSFRLLPRDLNA